MTLPFSIPVMIALYSLAWVALHIGCGYLAHRLPASVFAPGRRFGALLAARRWERGGEIYDRALAVRRWKDALPEAGSLFRGGFDKRHLVNASREHLLEFETATNRAEFSHWLTLCAGLTFFLWNPWWIGLFMTGYAALTNLPFIVVQRFNRPRMAALARLVEQRRRQVSLSRKRRSAFGGAHPSRTSE